MPEDPRTRLAHVMRRQPVQRRGAATVAAILDACAELLDEQDYDGVTTARIAEVANVPIGSFYQYFPDKRSVVMALALRGTEEFLSELERFFAEEQVSNDWRQGITQVLGVYQRMADKIAGFGRVRFCEVMANPRLVPNADHNSMMSNRLAELFATKYGKQLSETFRLAFRMTVEAADAMLNLVQRVPAEQREQVLATANDLITILLAKEMGEHASAS